MYGKPLDAISYECVQDVEGRSQKVGLTAAKLELDARPLNESIMRAALRTNQFLWPHQPPSWRSVVFAGMCSFL